MRILADKCRQHVRHTLMILTILIPNYSVRLDFPTNKSEKEARRIRKEVKEVQENVSSNMDKKIENERRRQLLPHIRLASICIAGLADSNFVMVVKHIGIGLFMRCAITAVYVSTDPAMMLDRARMMPFQSQTLIRFENNDKSSSEKVLPCD